MHFVGDMWGKFASQEAVKIHTERTMIETIGQIKDCIETIAHRLDAIEARLDKLERKG